ncbi:glycosyltransferase family protein [Geomonas agri]|uniref:hypothetical protein n=1 Tax=Geomonas agri TaxID=2873702 RepID=UPI001CD209BD|nr:hypothetical protein [Geomonas agri]
MSRLWITWERQRRNLELCRALSCKYNEFNYDNRNGFLRYFLCLYQTILLINKEKPKVVFGQNPSVLLALVLVMLKNIFGYFLVIDAHNAGIYPFEGKYSCVNSVMKRFHSLADLVLVTNDKLKGELEKAGGKVFVLPDKVPMIASGKKKHLDGKINVLFVCKFRDDEPYLEAFEAMRGVPGDFILYVTGKYNRVPAEVVAALPQNVRLIGFVPEQEYEAMLCSVDAVMDLTTRDNCLLCGAYEAVGAEKPMVLSRKKALQEYFTKGVIYVDNTAEAIRDGLKTLNGDYPVLAVEIISLKKELETSWITTLQQLERSIRELQVAEEV